MRLVQIVVALAAMSSYAHAQQADSFPTKPVQIIIGAAAGNSPDVGARFVADRLGRIWKQQVVVINRPGAGGLIGAQVAAGADKDGYTLFVAQASIFTVLPFAQSLPFDLNSAFRSIGLIGEIPIAITVGPSVPANTLGELLGLIKNTSGGMLYAASNRGGQSHLTGELLKVRTGADITFVHAAGAASSVTDVTAGRIPIMMDGIASLNGALQSGMLKPLAIGSAERLPNFPNLPTFKETVPGLESKGWLALMAPAGVPDSIIRKVNADLRKALAEPELGERLQTIGTYVRAMSPEETDEFIRSEQAIWKPIVEQVEGKR